MLFAARSIDNSEWMRNGDYIPTRMEAQHDAANLVSGAKTQQNPESTVRVRGMHHALLRRRESGSSRPEHAP